MPLHISSLRIEGSLPAASKLWARLDRARRCSPSRVCTLRMSGLDFPLAWVEVLAGAVAEAKADPWLAMNSKPRGGRIQDNPPEKTTVT